MTTCTPYDTGHRAQPGLWPVTTQYALDIGSDTFREMEYDRFGRVDFDADGDTLATAYAERVEGGHYVLDVYAHDETIIVRESATDANAEMRDALDAYTRAIDRAANLHADATDIDDIMHAEGLVDDAREVFAPLAARWIATRLGVTA